MKEDLPILHGHDLGGRQAFYKEFYLQTVVMIFITKVSIYNQSV